MKAYLYLLSTVIGCLLAQARVDDTNGAKDFLLEIKSAKDYTEYKGKPLSDKYGQVDALKIVYEIATQKIYFVQSEKFEYHFDFCKSVLNYGFDLNYFNKTNYNPNQNRKYILSTVNFYESKKLYTLEFASWEHLDEQIVADMYNRIAQKVFFHKQFYYFPCNDKQQEIASHLPKEIKRVNISDIYGNQIFQALNAKETYGYLRIVDIDALDKTRLTPNDILLVNGTPNEVPVISGIITNQFQTPLSHITLLSMNRGTPLMAYKKIWGNATVEKMKDRLVYFKVTKDTFELRKADLSEAMQFWGNLRKGLKLSEPRLDTTKTEIYNLVYLNKKSLPYIGGKAANFAEMCQVVVGKNGKVPLPNPAYAIPFYYYWQHIHDNNIHVMIDSLLDVISKEGNYKKTDAQLKRIRKAIMRAPLNKDFLRNIETLCKSEILGSNIRFRSSTNAEDIEGFNGAGLYASKTAIKGDTSKTIEKAIKKVWASTWDERPFYERQFFNINQHKIAMGILVHQGFPDEYSNGVSVSKNLYRADYPAYIINIQKGEEKVVSPSPNVTCDQIICYDKDNDEIDAKDRIEYISYSSLNNNVPINSVGDIAELAEILKAIKDHYYYKLGYSKICDYANFGLDYEFKYLKPDKRIIIKQVRTFKN